VLKQKSGQTVWIFNFGFFTEFQFALIRPTLVWIVLVYFSQESKADDILESSNFSIICAPAYITNTAQTDALTYI